VLGGKGGREEWRELLCDKVVGVEEKLNRKSSNSAVFLSNAGVEADMCAVGTPCLGSLTTRRAAFWSGAGCNGKAATGARGKGRGFGEVGLDGLEVDAPGVPKKVKGVFGTGVDCESIRGRSGEGVEVGGEKVKAKFAVLD
jgi:hypothetical protein